jgi:hypothetical protein
MSEEQVQAALDELLKSVKSSTADLEAEVELAERAANW